MYTAFHFAVFALLGMGLVVLVHWAIRDSVVRYALLPVFLVFEVMFYGLLEVLSERTNTLFSVLGCCECQHPRRTQHGVLPLGATPGFSPFVAGYASGRRASLDFGALRPGLSQVTFQPHLTTAGLCATEYSRAVFHCSLLSCCTPRPLRPNWSHLQRVVRSRWIRNSACWGTTNEY